MAGYRNDGDAIWSDVIGDAAEIPNVRPQTVPSTPDYTVGSLSALNSALASATAGQTILVQDGSYGAWIPSKTNAGAAIRVVGENWWGTSGTYASFSSITPDGVTGVSFENLRVTGMLNSRKDTGYDGADDCSFLSCLIGYFYMRQGSGITIQYCIMDRNYDGNCMNLAEMAGVLTIRNNIFARAGNSNAGTPLPNSSDNIQIQGHDTLIFEYNALWGNETLYDGAPHPDIAQINGAIVGTGQITIRRNIFWERGRDGTYFGAEGLYLSDANWTDPDNVIEENLICRTGLARTLSINGVYGNVRNNTVCGRIYLEDKNGTGDNTGLYIDDNFCQEVYNEGGGTPISETGNTEYLTGSYNTYLKNTSGNMSSWRDYIPVDDDYDKYTPYIAELVAEWDGVATPTTPFIVDGGAFHLNGLMLLF